MQNKCLGVFLIFLCVPLVILSILELAIVFPLYKKTFYKNILNRNNSYESVNVLIQKNAQDKEDIFSIVGQNIDPSWLKENTEYNLDELFSFLGNKKNLPNLGIDLTTIKTNLEPTSEVSEETIKMIPDQLTLQSYKDFLEGIQGEIKKQSSEVPQSEAQDIDSQISSIGQISAQLDQNLLNVRRGFNYAKIIGYVIFGLTALMLLIIGLLCRKKPETIPRWIGIALAIPAILTFVIDILINKLVLAKYNFLDSVQMSSEVSVIVKPLYESFTNYLINSVFKISLIVLIVGIFLILISYLIGLFIKKPVVQNQA